MASSGAFQACGFFTGQTGVEGGGVGSGSSGWPARGCPSLTPSSASYEQVKMDDGKRLQKVRDGQELDYGAAISLLQAMGVNSVLGGAAGEGEERCLLLHLLPLACTQIPPPPPILLSKFSLIEFKRVCN